jgi:hypothetical protein
MEPTVRPGGRLARFTEAALASGVRRLVLLSAARASDPGSISRARNSQRETCSLYEAELT